MDGAEAAITKAEMSSNKNNEAARRAIEAELDSVKKQLAQTEKDNSILSFRVDELEKASLTFVGL